MMQSGTEGGNRSAFQVLSYEEYPLLMPLWGYVASAFVLFLIGFFGFFLNLMVILLMFKDRQLWTPINMILFNLVCADFSVSLLGNPFTLVSALYHRWVFGHHMCVLYGFFMSLLGITSITTLTVLSFERYLMVTRPLSPRHLTPRGAAFTIVFIWAYALALTTPPLVGWGNYVSEGANISCSVNWQEQTHNTFTYIMFLFATGQTIPCLVISFSYFNIVRTLKRTSARTGRVNRGEAKVTVMVFVMIVAFMVAWTPYSVVALMEQFGESGVVSPGVAVIPALIAKSSICYDPIIYIGMNTQFRQSIKRVFGIHSTRPTCSNMERGVDNTVMSAAPGVCTRNKLHTADTTSCETGNRTTIKKVTMITESIPRNANEYEDRNSNKGMNIVSSKSSEMNPSETPKSNSSNDLLRESSNYHGANFNIDRCMVAKQATDSSVNVNKNPTYQNQINNSPVFGAKASRGQSQDTTVIKHSVSMEMNKVQLDLRNIAEQASSEDLRTRMRPAKISNSGRFLEQRQDNFDNFKAFLFSNDKKCKDEIDV